MVMMKRMQSEGEATAPKENRKRLAQTLAATIEAEIESAGWPVDRLLGSEPELCARYGVSRGVFREAARLLEHYSVARMRSGRNGGLVVAEPDASAIGRGAALMLRRKLVTPEHLVAARRSIELTCVRLATESIDQQGIERLHACLVDEQSMTGSSIRTQSAHFHLLLAELTQNPVLDLFAKMLSQLTQQRLTIVRTELNRATLGVHRAHSSIVEAIEAGDADLAQSRMEVHFDAMARTWAASGDFDGAPVSPFSHNPGPEPANSDN
jgi:DNA-binding FadR family transcriptional regulator